MFQVIADTIYFHGQPLAVITMPLSGLKLEAVDALNMVDYYDGDSVRDILKEVKADVNHAVIECLTEAVEAVWLNDTQHEWIMTKMNEEVTTRTQNTWLSWSIDP